MSSKGSTKPEIVYDERTKTKYIQGRFLGKGGFARCYEFENCRTHEYFACKVVSKSMLTKAQQKEKMSQEISIHRSLSHKYIVQFHSFFEDENFVYIVLELCRKRSLMEMHKRRKAFTENEVRYFLRQIVLGCIYLHQNKVIHRDLKLGNLFINDEMEIKIGDFGLATKIGFEGERKKTLCGTPNYIAPEILSKRGHSYEVDVWSLGCIMYTLLVGSPPFETHTLKDTYSKIRKNDYTIPSRISKSARALIQKMLRLDPSARPTMQAILTDDFFISGYLPQRLPSSCLTMPPRFSAKQKGELENVTARKPLAEMNKGSPTESGSSSKSTSSEKPVPIAEKDVAEAANDSDKGDSLEVPKDYYLSQLYHMVVTVLDNKPKKVQENMHDEALDPAAVPFIWISKWVDYTDKYGMGYTLCDNSVGILFNDSTRLILLANEENFYYIDRNGEETSYVMSSYPPTLNKKVTLLKYFRTYMANNLLKAGEAVPPREGDELTQVPYLYAWFRTRSAMVFHLTNGTLQINFFEDHTKVILCPLMGAFSYIDENQEFLSYRINLFEKYGASEVIYNRLEYAKLMIEKLATSSLVAGKAVNKKGDKVQLPTDERVVEKALKTKTENKPKSKRL